MTAVSLLPRVLHPLAWWAWAIGIAIAASTTTNPLLLGMMLGVIALVVTSRRGSSPWAKAWRLYLVLGGIIVVLRIVLHVLVGLKYGEIRALPLPRFQLPSWAAGIELLGDVYLEGLLGAAVQGLSLATMIIAIGAANTLADPKRMLRQLPNALHEIGAAVVVSITVAPQMAESVMRVNRARALRGDHGKGIRALPRIALPVLHDTLDRSLALAGAMDSRGYGRGPASPAGRRRATAALTTIGLLGVCVGVYQLLDPTATGPYGVPLLVAGLVIGLGGLWLGGRGSTRTAYRREQWRWPELLTVACGALVAAVMLFGSDWFPDALAMPLEPLSPPLLPWPAALAILTAALPAFLTPPAPVPVRRVARPAADRQKVPA